MTEKNLSPVELYLLDSEENAQKKTKPPGVYKKSEWCIPFSPEDQYFSGYYYEYR
jgi:hypothetical protein